MIQKVQNHHNSKIIQNNHNSKIMPNTLYYSRGLLAKFYQKWQGENSPFLLHFLIHIHVHVLILHRKFELISIKIGFFTNF